MAFSLDVSVPPKSTVLFYQLSETIFPSWHSRQPELRRRRSILASRPRSWSPETATSRSETRVTRSSEPVICYFINCFEWLNSGKLNGYLFNVLTFKSLNTIWHFFFSIFCSLIRSIRSASPKFFCKTDNFCFYFNKIDNFCFCFAGEAIETLADTFQQRLDQEKQKEKDVSSLEGLWFLGKSKVFLLVQL